MLIFKLGVSLFVMMLVAKALHSLVELVELILDIMKPEVGGFRDDNEFLNYCWAHSETERALFSTEHAKRLYSLARVPEPEWTHDSGTGFVVLRHNVVHPLINRAMKFKRFVVLEGGKKS